MRNLTKMVISEAKFGVRRPMSTTFVDIFKGYNFVVYTKIKFKEEAGQICRIQSSNKILPKLVPR